MKRDQMGYWEAKLRPATGAYRFHYHVDGQWFADFAAFGIEYGPYDPDSIVNVRGAAARVEPAAVVSRKTSMLAA